MDNKDNIEELSPSNELSESNIEKLELLDQKLEDEKREQEERLLIDFDEVVKEHKSKPFTIRFQDKFYEIPASMPLDFSMFFFRWCLKRKNGKQVIDIPEDKFARFIELMLGKQFLNSLESSKQQFEFDMIMDKLATPILDEWGYGVSKDNKNQAKKKYG
ncbi:MAG: hypothetical protein ABF289_18235 [Clostridiales bacterium]